MVIAYAVKNCTAALMVLWWSVEFSKYFKLYLSHSSLINTVDTFCKSLINNGLDK